MARTIRYREIAASIRDQIDSGALIAGELLPSEADLVGRHDASRVTIRKALELLRDEGLVESRQGYGWMVAAAPFSQFLGTLRPIERQLADSGRSSDRIIVDFGFEAAPERVATVLGATVLRVRRINRADNVPVARVTVWCREDLGANLSRADVARSSFYELLPGLAARATQTISAELMTNRDAELLAVASNSAALVVRRTSYDRAGRAVLMSEHCFPGHLTEFVAELASAAEPEESGEGFRLVEGS